MSEHPIVDIEQQPALATQDSYGANTEQVAEGDQSFIAFVRRVKCVICQIEDRSRLLDDDHDIPISKLVSYEPELTNVSDANHVITRGAGGPDDGNLIPLCQKHHKEFHQIGLTNFEMKYGLSMHEMAIELFNIYLNRMSGNYQGAEMTTHTMHRRILATMNTFRTSGLHLGRLLIEAKTFTVDGKLFWEALGFRSFIDYLSSPQDSGGLGLSRGMAYKCMNYAQAYELCAQNGRVEQIGIGKIDIIFPLLKRATNEQEKKELLDVAESLNTRELLDWKAKRRGEKPKRDEIKDLIRTAFTNIIQESGGEIDVELVHKYTIHLFDMLINYRSKL